MVLTTKIQILISIVIFLFVAISNAFAQADQSENYWTDSSGTPIRNSGNQCWRTSYWTSTQATLTCEPDIFLENHILPPHTGVQDYSFGTLVTNFWVWRFPTVFSRSGYVDPLDTNCALGQNGPVWFLAGRSSSGKSTRSCLIPSGKHIFVALRASAVFQRSGLLPDCANARATVVGNIDTVTSLSASLNGNPIPRLDSYRAKPFRCQTIEVQYEGKLVPLHDEISDGYYFLLKPLPPGHYVLELSSNNFSGDLPYEVVYRLEVQ